MPRCPVRVQASETIRRWRVAAAYPATGNLPIAPRLSDRWKSAPTLRRAPRHKLPARVAVGAPYQISCSFVDLSRACRFNGCIPRIFQRQSVPTSVLGNPTNLEAKHRHADMCRWSVGNPFIETIEHDATGKKSGHGDARYRLNQAKRSGSGLSAGSRLAAAKVTMIISFGRIAWPATTPSRATKRRVLCVIGSNRNTS